jgi:hypothetical protein
MWRNRYDCVHTSRLRYHYIASRFFAALRLCVKLKEESRKGAKAQREI